MYFKMYFFMFMTLCLFGHVEAKCLANTPPQETTSSSVKVCLKTYTPECGNLSSLDMGFNTFEQDGCIVFRCPARWRPMLYSAFENSEIPQPTDAQSSEALIFIYAPLSTEQTEDMFVSQFGIECDGNKWKVTKYPLGIYYVNKQYNDIHLGGGGSYDGMKSEIDKLGCSGNRLPGE